MSAMHPYATMHIYGLNPSSPRLTWCMLINTKIPIFRYYSIIQSELLFNYYSIIQLNLFEIDRIQNNLKYMEDNTQTDEIKWPDR